MIGAKGDLVRARRGIRFALGFTAILWTIKAFEFVVPTNFESLGILPRTVRGSIGIVTAPLIHGDVFHLISNTFPILVLVIGMFYFYHRIATVVFFLIYFMTGFWVWIAARDAYHIGASGLVYGLISFLLFSGFLRRDVQTLAVSFVVLLLYGSTMFYGLVPGNENVSWESHVLGAIAGLFCAIYFKPKKRTQRADYITSSHMDPFEESGYFRYQNSNQIEYHYKPKSEKIKYFYTIDDESSDEDDSS